MQEVGGNPPDMDFQPKTLSEVAEKLGLVLINKFHKVIIGQFISQPLL